MCRPKLRHRQAVQVGGKRNDLGAGVKHHSSEPSFAHRVGHRLQTSNIASAQCGAGLYLNSHQPPRTVFQHDVHFKRQLLAAVPGQFRRFHQSAFSTLPGTVDQNGRRIRQRLQDMPGNMATNHGCIIDHTPDDNHPRFGRLLGPFLATIYKRHSEHICLTES